MRRAMLTFCLNVVHIGGSALACRQTACHSPRARSHDTYLALGRLERNGWLGEAPIGTTFKLTSQPRRRQDKPGETWVSASTSASRYDHELSPLVTIASLMAFEFAVPMIEILLCSLDGGAVLPRRPGLHYTFHLPQSAAHPSHLAPCIVRLPLSASLQRLDIDVYTVRSTS